MRGKWMFSYGDNKHEIGDRIADIVVVAVTVLIVVGAILGIVWR